MVDDWGDDGVEIMVEDVDEGGDVDGVVAAAADFDFDIVDFDNNDQSVVAIVDENIQPSL